jgi:hypothetical protein
MEPVDLQHGRLHVNRAKGGIESVHPLHGPELRGLRPLQGSSPYVFVTEAGTPVTPAWFLRMIQRTGEPLGFPSRFIHICSGIRRDTSLRMMSRTLDHWLIIWGTAICNPPLDIRPWLLIGSKGSGRISVWSEAEAPDKGSFVGASTPLTTDRLHRMPVASPRIAQHRPSNQGSRNVVEAVVAVVPPPTVGTDPRGQCRWLSLE